MTGNVLGSKSTVSVKELIYIVIALGGLGGLYAEIRASDARQSAQIDNLVKARDENRNSILDLQTQVRSMSVQLQQIGDTVNNHEHESRERLK